MLIGALLLALLGAGLFVGVFFTRKRLTALLMAASRTAAELLGTVKSVSGEIGGGGFKEVVEVVGTVVCASPMTSPLAGKPCVAYTMKVLREYEEDYEEKDSQGKVTKGTRRGSEVIQSDDRECDFTVRDATGELPVHARGADFEGMVESFSRFDPGAGGATLSIGSFNLTLSANTARRRTLGYRSSERIFPLGGRVTIIAEASDAHGQLALGKGEQSFIVSTRTRQEMRGSAETKAKVLGVCGTLSIVGAVVCLVLGLVKG